MTAPNLDRDFFDWLDRVCSRPMSKKVVAFNFNIYECAHGFQVELIGASRYDPDDDDWACRPVFSSSPRRFDLDCSSIGSDWRAALSLVEHLARSYLDQSSDRSACLRRAKAVTVGFVDGDLVRVWPRENPA